MSTLKRRDEMRPETQLSTAVESFFRANYDIAPKTRRWYAMYLSQLVGFLRHSTGREPELQDFTKSNADAFLYGVSQRPTAKYPLGSPFNTRGASASLKRLGSFLAQDGILHDEHGQSVVKNVKRGKVDDDVRQPLTDDEVDLVLQAAGRPGTRDHALIVFTLGTGLRLSELRLAEVRDSDSGLCQFTVRPETSKFGRSRVVYFHKQVARELDRYLRDRHIRSSGDPLFPTDAEGYFDEDGFGKVFARVSARSGVPFSAHVLRHTWATNFMRQPGADLLQLKRQGGWKRWEQVERYAHAIPPKDREALPNPLRRIA